MSAYVLSEAVVSVLQAGFVGDGLATGTGANHVALQPGGHPPTAINKYFVSVDVATWQNAGDETQLQETYSLNVWITKPINAAAKDRYRSLFAEPRFGIDALKDAVEKWVHGNTGIMTAANALLPDANSPFSRCLYLAGSADPPEFQDGSWNCSTGDQKSFVVLKLTFTGALRVRSVTR